MLVDLIEPIDLTIDDQMAAILAIIEPETPKLERLGQGLYRGGLNAQLLLESLIENKYPFDPIHPPEGFDSNEWRREIFRRYQDVTYPCDYGVVDYPAQVVETFPLIIEDERPLIITLGEVRKDRQSDQGGWRWHKGGTYYGVHEPQCEYIYDEPDIDAVWVFHIMQVKEGSYVPV